MVTGPERGAGRAHLPAPEAIGAWPDGPVKLNEPCSTEAGSQGRRPAWR